MFQWFLNNAQLGTFMHVLNRELHFKFCVRNGSFVAIQVYHSCEDFGISVYELTVFHGILLEFPGRQFRLRFTK